VYYARVLKGGQIELSNCGLIAGAFSSTSGKADTVLTTSGDILYYTSSRQRLPIGSEGTVLTVSGSDLPAWTAASAGALELLDYEDFSADAASYTFTPSSDLTNADYGQFLITITGKTDAVNAIPTIIFSDSASNVYAVGATIEANGDRTSLTVSNAAPINIGNATTFFAAAKDFTCLISVTINPLLGMITGYMQTFQASNLFSEQKWFEVSATVIDKVEIEMSSTGKFKADTRFSFWGIKNA
tara:strand:- start:42 stop:770 length:729 start_codon:yes stop_codon:yes gene_type:complete